MFEQIKTLLKNTEDYVETNVKLARLETVRTSTEIMSYLFSMIILMGTLFLFAMILFIGLSILAGRYLNSMEDGFFATGGFLLLIFLILFLCRKKLLRSPASNLLIKKILG
jgi:uncharacterized RDD family membrane protein YckC